MADTESLIPQDSPVRVILVIVGKFLRRRKKVTTQDKAILAMCLLCASFVFTLAFIYKSIEPNNWQFATALITLSGVFYGTICLGIFLPARNLRMKVEDAEDLQEEMEEMGEKYYGSYRNQIRVVASDLPKEDIAAETAQMDTFLRKLKEVYEKIYS